MHLQKISNIEATCESGIDPVDCRIVRRLCLSWQRLSRWLFGSRPEDNDLAIGGHF